MPVEILNNMAFFDAHYY